LSAEGINSNPARVKAIIEQRATPVQRKERHLDPADVDQLLRWARRRVVAKHRSSWEKLRALRDYAFLLLLVDTGLRVGEACSLNMDAHSGESDHLFRAMPIPCSGHGDHA
jgi:integrase